MSKRIKTYRRSGFTLIELAITAIIMTIVLLSVAVILVDGQRSWHKMYNRIYSDVVVEGIVARKTFDHVIRKSTREVLALDSSGDWIEVYYYQDPAATKPDRYALFYESGDELKLETGTVDPKAAIESQTICSNVSNCMFQTTTGAVQMYLTLDNGSESTTVMTSAVMHN